MPIIRNPSFTGHTTEKERVGISGAMSLKEQKMSDTPWDIAANYRHFLPENATPSTLLKFCRGEPVKSSDQTVFGAEPPFWRRLMCCLTGPHQDTEPLIDPASKSHDTTTAVGLLQIVFDAWRNDCSVQIPACMVWFTIAQNLADLIARQPANFTEFFTTSAEKIGLTVLVGNPLDLDGRKFVGLLRDEFVKGGLEGAKLCDLLMKPFVESPQGAVPFERSMAATLCMMTAPYFVFSTILCGLRSIDLGDARDWTDLEARVTALAAMLGEVKVGYRNQDTVNSVYLADALKCVKMIARVARDPTSREAASFVRNCIHVEGVCGCGPNYTMTGWIYDLVHSSIEASGKIAYFPWTLEKRMFYEAHAMRADYGEDGFFRPRIDCFVYEVNDTHVFDLVNHKLPE